MQAVGAPLGRPGRRGFAHRGFGRINNRVVALNHDYTQGMPSGGTFSRASIGTDIVEGKLYSFASGTPRQSAANGLLIEGQRTNLVTQSEALSTGWGSTGTSKSDVATIDPYGNSTTCKFVTEDTSTGAHEVSFLNTGLTSSAYYAWSVFIKGNGSRWATVTNYDGTSSQGSCTIDLATGAITSSSGNFLVWPMQNGWYRVSVFGAIGASATLCYGIVKLTDNTNAVTYTGDGTSGVFVWGGQFEEGLGPSSYIPTTTVATTRAAEVLDYSLPKWLGKKYTTAINGRLPRVFPVSGTDIDGVCFMTMKSTTGAAGDRARFLLRSYDTGKVSADAQIAYSGYSDMSAGVAPGNGCQFGAAASFDVSGSYLSVNNSTVVSDLTVPDVPDMSGGTVRVGSDSNTGGGQYAWGYITSLRIYGKTTPSSDLPLMSFPAPIYNWDFRGASLPAGFAFSRAGAATDFINGYMLDYPSGTPRLSAKGILIEESRTNSNRFSEGEGGTVGVIGADGDMPQGWLVDTFGGLSVELQSSEVRNNMRVNRFRISGTASGTVVRLRFDSLTSIAANLNEVWTGSMFVAMVAGSLDNVTSVNTRVTEFSSGAATLAQTQTPFTPTAELTRYSHIATLSKASVAYTNVMLAINFNIGAEIDVTLEVSSPQMELGYGATSYIRTTTAAATRPADQLTRPVYLHAINGAGAVRAKAKTAPFHNAAASISPRLFNFLQVNSGSYQIVLSKAAGTGVVTGLIQYNAATQCSLASGPAVGLAAPVTASIAWASNSVAVSVLGDASATDNTSLDGIPAAGNIRVGSASPSQGHWNGYIEELNVWGYRVPNVDLERLSAA